MKKIEKELLVALEEAMFNPNEKHRVEGFKDSGKAYYVEFKTNETTGESDYILYQGKQQVTLALGTSYLALVTEIFARYIEF